MLEEDEEESEREAELKFRREHNARSWSHDSQKRPSQCLLVFSPNPRAVLRATRVAAALRDRLRLSKPTAA